MNLREARNILGLSLEGAARRMGVSSRTVFRWEHGELDGAPVKARSQLQERALEEFKRAAGEAQAPSVRKFVFKQMEGVTGFSVYSILQAEPALQAELEEFVKMEVARLGRGLAIRLVVETSPE
jgi:transcriptional regulator with XRE-family HTH domain